MSDPTSVRWYVHCGCDGHGDHGGCTKACRNYGCAHPVGVEITAETEEESDALDGQEPTPEAVVSAATEAIARIQAKADKKIARLHRLIARQQART